MKKMMKMMELEAVLLQLLVPDNAVIQQATAELKVAFRSPTIIAALCSVLTASQNPQVRQLAAVLLRRRAGRQWKKLADDTKISLKPIILQILRDETEHTVRRSAAHLAADVSRHEGATAKRWPELLQFLTHATRSHSPQERELGMLVLSVVLDRAPRCLRPQHRDLLRLLQATLADGASALVPYYSARCLRAVVPLVGSDEMNAVRALVPRVMEAVVRLVEVDEDKACEAMEVFEEMIESEVSILASNIADLVRFSLQLASNPQLGDSIRVKALSLISWLAKTKSKALVKHKLVAPVLSALFPIASAAPPDGTQDPEDEEERAGGDDEDEGGDDDDEEDVFTDNAEAHTPKHFAVQVIDVLALHLPPDKLLPHLTLLMEPALLSEDPYRRKAGLMCLAVLAEGCADHIRNKCLEPMLRCVCRGMSDPSHIVQNAALFALGQFSEHLQPEVSAYSSEVMPLLMAQLGYGGGERGPGVARRRQQAVTRAYYALDNFVESLGENVVPYLPALLQHVLAVLASGGGGDGGGGGGEDAEVKELAISAVGAIANAAKLALLPYFPTVMEHLKRYLVTKRPEDMQLQIQALDTLGVLARAVGSDAFSPLVEECAMLGLGLIDQVDDPDLRRCTYGLFASLSAVMGASMAPHLEKITTRMLLSLRSTDGIVTHYNEEGGDEEDRSFLLLDDDGLEEEEEEEGDEEEDITSEECRSFDDDDDDVAGYSVGNAYLEEKEDACNALGEIAVNTGVAFLPFLEATFTDVFKMVEYPAEDVRKAALRGLGQLCVALHAVCKQQPSPANLDALRRLLCATVPCFCARARSERDRHVVMAALEAQNELLTACGAEALAAVPGSLDDVTSLLRDVLQRKVTCQGDGAGDEGDEDGGEDEEQQAEYDAMLLEFAGEGVPLLAKATGGGEAFAPYFAGFLPMLLAKMRRGSTASERSLAVGVLAETVAALDGRCCRRFAGPLLPPLAESARDDDAEVRGNAVFGLGVLAHGAGDVLAPHLPLLLGLLSSVLSGEENRRVVDNACGALARIITSASPTLLVPVEQVFPAMLQALPLVEDLEENSSVFTCVTHLYQASLSQVLQNLGPVLRAVGHVLGTTQITEAVETSLRVMVLDLAQRHPAEFHAALSTLPAHSACRLLADPAATLS